MSAIAPAILRGGEVVGQHVWFEALDPVERDFAVLKERFGLPGRAVKDAMHPAQAPKLDVYEDQLFVALKIARLVGDVIEYAGLDAFVSRHHIVTVRHGANATYARPDEEGASGSPLRPDFILHAVMDLVVDGYFPVVEMVEDQVFSMEQHLLDSSLDREKVTQLFRLRREAIHLQHVFTRMSDVCGKLANVDLPCIGADSRPYFRDLHDRLVRLNTMTGGLVEVTRAVFEASNLLEQQRQGTTTRQLAAWAAILGVPTAIAGVYSMNAANMAELQGPYGYPIVVAVMLAMCAALYVRFKKLRWL